MQPASSQQTSSGQSLSDIAAAAANGANGSADTASLEAAHAPHLNGGEPGELRELLHALQAMRVGDFSVRMAGDQVGIMGKVADTFNEIVAANQRISHQLERVGQVVGREGKTRQRVRFGLSEGAWGEMEFSVNTLIDDLLWPTTEVTRASPRWRRATSCRPCSSMSTAGRCRASSCARRRSSTP